MGHAKKTRLDFLVSPVVNNVSINELLNLCAIRSRDLELGKLGWGLWGTPPVN